MAMRTAPGRLAPTGRRRPYGRGCANAQMSRPSTWRSARGAGAGRVLV